MDGLFRSTATERDLVRRRLVGLTTVAGVTAAGAVVGLCVGLAPAHAGTATVVRTPDGSPDGSPAGTPAPRRTGDRPPVATSGGS